MQRWSGLCLFLILCGFPAVVHAADIQDRDGGPLVIKTMHGLFPFVTKLFADGGYQGPQFRHALAKVMPHGRLLSISAFYPTKKTFWPLFAAIAWN